MEIEFRVNPFHMGWFVGIKIDFHWSYKLLPLVKRGKNREKFLYTLFQLKQVEAETNIKVMQLQE